MFWERRIYWWPSWKPDLRIELNSHSYDVLVREAKRSILEDLERLVILWGKADKKTFSVRGVVEHSTLESQEGIILERKKSRNGRYLYYDEPRLRKYLIRHIPKGCKAIIAHSHASGTKAGAMYSIAGDENDVRTSFEKRAVGASFDYGNKEGELFINGYAAPLPICVYCRGRNISSIKTTSKRKS